jgi:hypothetical protein
LMLRLDAETEADRRLLEPLVGLTTLEALLRHAFVQPEPWSVVEVVVQDEYTHDVVVAAGDRYLVFDST